jgi:prophage regulatory protein
LRGTNTETGRDFFVSPANNPIMRDDVSKFPVRTAAVLAGRSNSGKDEESGATQPAMSAVPSAHRVRPVRMLRLGQVLEVTGLGKTKIYDLQAEGRFPMRVKITAHAVGWIEQEVQSWLAGRIAKNNPLRTHGSRADKWIAPFDARRRR